MSLSGKASCYSDRQHCVKIVKRTQTQPPRAQGDAVKLILSDEHFKFKDIKLTIV